MIFTKDELEAFAICFLDSFNRRCHIERYPRRRKYARAVPIDRFVNDFLHFDIHYKTLSADGSVLGISVYRDTFFEYRDGDDIYGFPICRNDIFLDERFCGIDSTSSLWGLRRFTLAHECAHQLLHRMNDPEEKAEEKRRYDARLVFTPKELRKIQEQTEAEERQADMMAAALLMPGPEMDKAMSGRYSKITSYDGLFNRVDRRAIQELCDTFQVSRSAMIIRLDELGYLEKRCASEYTEPLEMIENETIECAENGDHA